MPFGNFAKGFAILYDVKTRSKKEIDQIQDLKSKWEAFFFDIIEEAISVLEDECGKLEGIEGAIIDAISFLTCCNNGEVVVKEWVICAYNRAWQN